MTMPRPGAGGRRPSPRRRTGIPASGAARPGPAHTPPPPCRRRGGLRDSRLPRHTRRRHRQARAHLARHLLPVLLQQGGPVPRARRRGRRGHARPRGVARPAHRRPRRARRAPRLDRATLRPLRAPRAGDQAWTEAEIGGSEFGRLGTDVLSQFTRVLHRRIAAVAPPTSTRASRRWPSSRCSNDSTTTCCPVRCTSSATR